MKHKSVQKIKIINGSKYILIPKFVCDDMQIDENDVVAVQISKYDPNESE